MSAHDRPQARAVRRGLPALRFAAAALATAAAMLPVSALAAVEFVTRIGVCSKVDTIGDGKDLSVQAGENLQFEVWGDGIDVNPRVRVTLDDSNAGTVAARILRTHNGIENMGRGCKTAKGSVEVEVDSSAATASTLQRSLHFRMPLGDESRLAMRIVPFRTPVWTVVRVSQTPVTCLTRSIGTIVTDMNNSRVVITLPPGASGDTSNCALRLETRVDPADRPEIDIQGPFNYSMQFPAHLRFASGNNASSTGALQTDFIAFDGDIANIRRTTAVRTNTLTITAPNPSRSDTLTLRIDPPAAGNAFTQACVCRNAQTGDTINVNDAFQCELRLAQQPSAGGQLISMEAQDRLCVAAGASPPVTYSSASGLGSFTAPNTSTFHQIPMRALGGTTSAGTPCASRTSPVAHTLKFWVGQRGAESGPAYTQCQIRIRVP